MEELWRNVAGFCSALGEICRRALVKLYEIRVRFGLGLHVFWLLRFKEEEWKLRLVVKKVCWPGKSANVTWSSPAVGEKGARAAAWESFDQRTWERQSEICLHGWAVVMLEQVGKRDGNWN